MVLKSLVRYLINQYLKDYIEQLDNEKLKLDFKHGNVSLENLHLKPEALVGFGIPVTVAFGFIEKLSIVISWRNLHSHPTKIHIEGFYMLIVPKNEMHQDLTEYHLEKMKRVQRKLENLRKSLSDEDKIDEKEKGFFEKMKFQMMQNLQLTLTNFHISYETKSTTKLGHPFSFGITIHSLQLFTSTNTKPIGNNKENTLIIIKVKEINYLSIYWNTNSKSRINMPFQHVIEDLKSKIATNSQRENLNEMNYILSPINFNFNLEMILKFAERNFERPIIKLSCEIEELNFEINPKQLSDLLDFVKFQNYSVFYDRCREYRQLLYFQQSKLTQQQKDRIQLLESKLDVYSLAYIQHTIQLEIHHQNNHNYNWWNWWWNEKPKLNQYSTNLLDHHQTNIKEQFFSQELLDIDAQIIVNKLEFDLLSSLTKSKKVEIISHIQIDDTLIHYKRRAISSSILLILDLGYFQIFGLKSNEEEDRPLMLTSPSLTKPLIHIEFELAPIDKKSDYRFVLIVEPLTIIYHAETINQIVDNFESIDKNSFLLSPQIKRRTFEEMEEDLSNKKMFDMIIEMKGLSLLLPQHGFYTNHSKAYVIHFNDLILKSSLNNQKEDQMNLFKKEKEERRYYNKYKLIWKNLGIIYLESNKQRLEILKSIPMIEIYFYKCIYVDDAHLTDWKIDFQIPEMSQISLSENILITLTNHYQTIPLFYSTMSQTLFRFNLFFTIFPPDTTIETYLSINKFCFIIDHFKQLIQTDLFISISKTRNLDEYNQYLTIIFKNLIMKLNSLFLSNESSCPFYQNNHIELLYSDTDTKL